MIINMRDKIEMNSEDMQRILGETGLVKELRGEIDLFVTESALPSGTIDAILFGTHIENKVCMLNEQILEVLVGKKYHDVFEEIVDKCVGYKVNKEDILSIIDNAKR